jgi:hypothetical protein
MNRMAPEVKEKKVLVLVVAGLIAVSDLDHPAVAGGVPVPGQEDHSGIGKVTSRVILVSSGEDSAVVDKANHFGRSPRMARVFAVTSLAKAKEMEGSSEAALLVEQENHFLQEVAVKVVASVARNLAEEGATVVSSAEDLRGEESHSVPEPAKDRRREISVAMTLAKKGPGSSVIRATDHLDRGLKVHARVGSKNQARAQVDSTSGRATSVRRERTMIKNHLLSRG